MDARNENSPKTARTIMIALAVALGVVMAIFIYVWVDRAKMISELTTDKYTLELKLEDLRAEYDSLQTTNDTINLRLVEEREKVEVLIDRLKKTDASNRARMRQYEQELGLLRDIMRGYVRKIDSLNTLNQSLRAEAIMARNEAAATDRKYETLVKHTDELTEKVEKGSVIRIRDVTMTAITKRSKETTRSRSTVKLRTCFTFVENSIAERGFRNVYVRIKGPDSILLTQGQQYFTVDNEQLIYSEMREVDYQGEDLEVCVFYGGPDEKFVKGVYTVDVYSGNALLGSGQVLLK